MGGRQRVVKRSLRSRREVSTEECVSKGGVRHERSRGRWRGDYRAGGR